MTAPASKTCIVCHKDVSNAKRVKDPQGHYYCAECHEKALQTHRVPAQTAAGAAAKTPMVKAAVAAPLRPPADDDDLLPMVPVTTRPAPPAAGQPAPKGPPKIPEFCPACGTKTLPGRRLCFKCNRDVTQMDKLVAMRAEAAKGPGKDEKFAAAFGVVMKIVLSLIGIGLVGLVLYVIYAQFVPGGLWDHYPTNREQLVRDYFKYISEGTDASFDKAFLLVSFREASTGKPGEDDRYKMMYRKLRTEFSEKYGSDWYSKIKVEYIGPNEAYADDEEDYNLIINNDKYKVATQVQMDVTRATALMTLPRHGRTDFKEDGKNHFGIIDIEGYKVNARRTMVERVGPGMPEKLPG